ncbi:hypothetical protein [Bradyrhizobium sp. AS23.2]|uniref:hypothetical protein n=1 Tax=Bradyrhizobium sp. AS23.2 TaxID=1680155 RepID=UPI000939436E|nr:hypothetical protein [Bradyrhizobium sp. AS23.2]OKO85067.1 hypothetical protein AC630_06790 [Bradyrhizobium sp. AS23.2]
MSIVSLLGDTLMEEIAAGAPGLQRRELAHVETNVPTSLSHQFAVSVTLTSLVFWFMLGGVTNVAFAHFDRGTLGASPHSIPCRRKARI